MLQAVILLIIVAYYPFPLNDNVESVVTIFIRFLRFS